MRPILCVIDLGESSGQVLEVAASMSGAYKSHLTILYPFRLIGTGYTGEISKLKAKLEQAATEKFLSIKTRIPMLDQLDYDFQPEIGFPADRINAFVRRNKVGAIVIGQNQATLMNEVNPSALHNLIADSKLPFTIIPEHIDVALVS